MRVSALAVEQWPAKLVLELLDRARQRRLADVALLRGTREVQRAREGDEIADLLHFHGAIPPEIRATITYTRRNEIPPSYQRRIRRPRIAPTMAGTRTPAV